MALGRDKNEERLIEPPLAVWLCSCLWGRLFPGKELDADAGDVVKGDLAVLYGHAREAVVGNEQVAVEVGPAVTAHEVSVMQPIMIFMPRARASTTIL